MKSKSEIASDVVLMGLQSWNRPIRERIGAWQSACDFMRLSVKVGTLIVKGELRYTFAGADADTAEQFVREVSDNFPIGKFEHEQEMVERCMDKYKKD